MKRPLAVFGFSVFGALLLLCFKESKALVFCALFVSVILLIISLTVKKIRQSVTVPLFLSALIAGCLLFIISDYNYQNVTKLCGEYTEVEAVVSEKPYFSEGNSRSYCYLNLISVGGKRVRSKMRLSFSQSIDKIDRNSLSVGDRVSFSAYVYPIGSFSESYLDYFKSQNTFFGAYSVENFRSENKEYRSFSYYIDFLRSYVIKSFSHDFDKNTASVLVAILTGEKTFMESELYESFKRSGVVHILAVSGMHLSIWINLIGAFISFRGFKGKLNGILMILFVIFMMNFASFTGSVRRAGMMSILYIIGKMLSKNSDSLNNLGFACISVLFYNPYAVCDVSFLLSVTATASIHIFALPVASKIMSFTPMKLRISLFRKIAEAILITVLISLGVMIFTLPVCIRYFGGVSLIAPLSNLMLFFVLAPLLTLTGLYTVLRFVPFIGTVCAVILKVLSSYTISVCTFFSRFDKAYIDIDPDKADIFLVILIVISVITYLPVYLNKKRNKKYI